MGAFTVLFVVFSALLVCAAVLGIQDGVRMTRTTHTLVTELELFTHLAPSISFIRLYRRVGPLPTLQVVCMQVSAFLLLEFEVRRATLAFERHRDWLQPTLALMGAFEIPISDPIPSHPLPAPFPPR